MSDAIVAAAWGKRAVILGALGVVGVGVLVGAGSVYILYLKRKFEEQFNIHATLTEELKQLREDMKLMASKSSIFQASDSNYRALKYKSALKDSNNGGKRVTFYDGYETADDDMYITASSESDDEPWTSQVILVDNPELNFYALIDQQLDQDPETQHEAYKQLKMYQERFKGSCGFWWRLAKATHLQAQAAKSNGDNILRKTLVYAAFTSADKALKLDDHNADAHKWFAITIGSKGDFLSTKEKILNGFVFKEHIDKAVSLNPNDSTLYHLLGRFCYEVSQLSWVERKVAATLFSAPPTATTNEALEHFLAAEMKGKPFKENRLFIAKCYIALSDNENAAKYLRLASNLPTKSASDELAQEDINKLLPKYQKYLS